MRERVRKEKKKREGRGGKGVVRACVCVGGSERGRWAKQTAPFLRGTTQWCGLGYADGGIGIASELESRVVVGSALCRGARMGGAEASQQTVKPS